MRYKNNHQRKLWCPGKLVPRVPYLRSASLTLFLLPCSALPQTAAPADRPAMARKTPPPAPPLYQRSREHRTNAVSMIYGVSEIGEPPAPAPPHELHSLAANPSCAAPPRPEQLHPFSLFQWMEKQQATALGLLFRAPDGAERPFLGQNALVWRSGATATCLSTEGTRTVVYGWEWDVGLVVDQNKTTQGEATFLALQAQDPPATILTFGENVNGAIERNSQLQKALTHLWTDWQSGPTGHLSPHFLEHFQEAQNANTTANRQPEIIQAIGSFLNR